MLSLSFYSFLLFPLTFFVSILLYLSETYILFAEISGRNFLSVPSAASLRTRLIVESIKMALPLREYLGGRSFQVNDGDCFYYSLRNDVSG